MRKIWNSFNVLIFSSCWYSAKAPFSPTWFTLESIGKANDSVTKISCREVACAEAGGCVHPERGRRLSQQPLPTTSSLLVEQNSQKLSSGPFPKACLKWREGVPKHKLHFLELGKLAQIIHDQEHASETEVVSAVVDVDLGDLRPSFQYIHDPADQLIPHAKPPKKSR